MAQIYAGTSGWAYPTWKPGFYPEKLPQKKFLEYYASRLNAVEVNYSFRHLLAEKTLQNWIATTPAEFRFCVKAHQVITHIKRLKDTAEFLQRFVGTLEPLAHAGKLGPVLFQLPPNMKADRVLLDEFLAGVPRALRSAFEFRHESWFADEIFAVLSKYDAALCVAESEKLESPDVWSSNFSYYRYRMPEYTKEERAAIAEKMQGHAAAQRDAYVFFKHEDTPEGALYASELLGGRAAEKTA